MNRNQAAAAHQEGTPNRELTGGAATTFLRMGGMRAHCPQCRSLVSATAVLLYGATPPQSQVTTFCAGCGERTVHHIWRRGMSAHTPCPACIESIMRRGLSYQEAYALVTRPTPEKEES